MATQLEERQPSTRRNLLRPIGVVLFVAGLIGVGYWLSLGFSASYSGTLAEDSIVSEAHHVLDWIPKPGIDDPNADDDSDWLVSAEDQDGNVIWEGPQDEWVALQGEAESAYQADLRRTWLYPSLAIALAGLLLVVFGRRRTATQNNRP